MNSSSTTTGLTRSLGTGQIMVAGVALVVAATTLVSDFAGYFALGGAFAFALALGFGINLLLGLSAADLAVSYPRAGAVYEYACTIIGGSRGRLIGTFLGLTFYGMLAFAASGEISAGAFGFRALMGGHGSIGMYVVILSILGVIPNIFGIRTTAWVGTGLLVLMLGVRWIFGIAGFLGLSHTGAWDATNLEFGLSTLSWFGDGGIIAVGLALGIWGFVGIEFVNSLAEEVKSPQKALPRGIIAGLVIILLTSLVMGLGVTGTQSLTTWQAVSTSALGFGGDAPQLAVGHMMFGQIGYYLMALASVAATLGSLVVAFAAMPRIIFSIARDGYLFGSASRPLARVHPRTGTPVVAILTTFALYTIPALFSAAVIDWLYSAAYVWLLMYVVFHLLALANRIRFPETSGVFKRVWIVPCAICGALATTVGLYYAFQGAHWQYGSRALIVFAAAGLVTVLSHVWSSVRYRKATPQSETTLIHIPSIQSQS